MRKVAVEGDVVDARQSEAVQLCVEADVEGIATKDVAEQLRNVVVA